MGFFTIWIYRCLPENTLLFLLLHGQSNFPPIQNASKLCTKPGYARKHQNSDCKEAENGKLKSLKHLIRFVAAFLLPNNQLQKFHSFQVLVLSVVQD